MGKIFSSIGVLMVLAVLSGAAQAQAQAHATVYKWKVHTGDGAAAGNAFCHEDRYYPQGRDMTSEYCLANVKRAKLIVSEDPTTERTRLLIQIVPWASAGEPLFLKLVYPSDLQLHKVTETNVGEPLSDQNGGYSRILGLVGEELASEVFGKALFALRLWWDPQPLNEELLLDMFNGQVEGKRKPVLKRQLYPYHTYTVPTFAKAADKPGPFYFEFQSRLKLEEFIALVNLRGISLYYAGETDELLLERISFVDTGDPKSVSNILPDAADSLVGYWRFNDSFDDESASAIDTVPINQPGFGEGKLGFSSLVLAQSSEQFLQINDLSDQIDGTSQFSFAAWVRTTASPGLDYGNMIFSAHDSAGENLVRIGTSINGSVFFSGFQGIHTIISPPINDGQWHHLAFTMDSIGNQVKVYVDGVLHIVNNTIPDWSLAALFSVGQDYDGAIPTDHFDGSIDELAVWNVVLDENQILNLVAQQGF